MNEVARFDIDSCGASIALLLFQKVVFDRERLQGNRDATHARKLNIIN